MNLAKKLTLFITTALATLCAVFSVATLRPATAFAASENNVARFNETAEVHLKHDKNTIAYEFKTNFSNYYTDNIKITFKIGVYEKAEVSTGWESVDQNVSFNDLESSSYNKLEYHEVEIYNRYASRSTIERKTGIYHTKKDYNPATMETMLYGPTGQEFSTFVRYQLREECFTNGTFTWIFYIAPNSNYQNYAMGISVNVSSYEDGTGTLFSDRNHKGTEDGKPYQSVSPLKSVANIVYTTVEDENYESSEYLDTLYSDIITSAAHKSVTVKYLAPIGEGIPFAKKVSKNIEVITENDGTINAVDVCAAVGVPYFDIFGTIYNGIEETSKDVWTVTYPKDLWLSTKVVGGNTINNFLDINISYQEYFYPFVLDGVFDQGLYEYLFATAVGNRYPEVATQGLSYADVYGYWDYVVMPETVGLDNLLSDVLGCEEKYYGFTEEFHYEAPISKAAYDKLLSDYNYSWLESAWNDIFSTGTTVGSYKATHYLVVCDPAVKDAFIDKPDSGDKNPGGGADDQFGDQVIDDVNGIVKWGEDLITGIGDIFTGEASFGAYVSVIALAGVVVFIVWLIKGNGFETLLLGGVKTKKRSKNNGNKRKKK